MARKTVTRLAVISLLLVLGGCENANFGLNVAGAPGKIRVSPVMETSSGNFTLSVGG